MDHGLRNESGENLYRRFLEGDHEAFEDFVLMYEDELSHYIYSIVRDYHETEFLTIETFSQMVLNDKKFSGNSSIKTYLFAIGKHLAFQMLRKRSREQHISFEEVAEIITDDEEPLQHALENIENKQYLKETMQELKEEYRAVLILLYFENMSYIQAGHAMNKSEKQIKNLAHRAKIALKAKLTEKGFVYTESTY